MIDKYDLKEAIERYMPDLRVLNRTDVLELIESMDNVNPRKIQVWAVTDDTVPLNCGVYDDITDFRVPVKLFKDDVTIEFEEYND